jgi:tetratricopeptide (TPR) repeat protein
VANVVGQAELTVGTLLLLALWLYGRDRRRGDLRVGTIVAIVVAFAVAMFLKEHSIVLPALLIALELAGRRVGFAPVADPWVPRLRLTVLLLGLTVALYLLVRINVLGLLTADDPHWSLRALSAGERAAVMLALVPEFVRLLFWPARLYADYSPSHTPVLPTLSWAHLPGTVTLLAIVALGVVAWRRRATLPLLALAWFVLTMALLSNLLFPIGVIIAERMLFLPSVGIALLAGWAAAEAAEWQGLRRALAVSVSVAAVLAGTVHSAIESQVWLDNPTLFSTLATRAPTNFRAPYALAEFNVLGGRFDVADTLFQRAMLLDPTHVPARLGYAQELQIRGRCDRALPLLRSARRDDPFSEAAVIGLGYCLLDAQRFSEARLTALQGLAVGMAPAQLRTVRLHADSMLAVTDSGDMRNRFVRDSLPFTRGGGPFVVSIRRMPIEELRRQWSLQRSGQGATPPTESVSPVKP